MTGSLQGLRDLVDPVNKLWPQRIKFSSRCMSLGGDVGFCRIGVSSGEQGHSPRVFLTFTCSCERSVRVDSVFAVLAVSSQRHQPRQLL